MTADTFTLAEIAEAMGLTKRAVELRATGDSWPCTERAVRGGRQRLYLRTDLPAAVQAALALRFPVSSPPASSPGGPSPARETAGASSSITLDGVLVDPSTGEVLGKATPRSEPSSLSGIQLRGDPGAAPAPAHDSESLWAAYNRAPEGMKAEAARKHRAILAVAQLVDYGQAVDRSLALIAGLQDGLTYPSLNRWWYADLRQGSADGALPRQDWLAALLDGYVGRTATAACSAEAWDWYKGQYLTRKQPSHADTYRRLAKMAPQQGWKIPSGKTLARRVDAEVHPLEQVYLRQGPEAHARKLPPQDRDRSHFRAGEAVNGDGLKFDRLWVRFPDGEVLNTATVWFWQDLYSNKILAWRAGKTENTDLFRLATYDLTAQCAPTQVWVDNTRVAANKLMTAGAEGRHRFRSEPEDGMGLLLMLGMTPRFTNPDKETGNPGAKPIERAFGIGGLHEMVATHPRFHDRGYSQATAIDFAEFCQVLNEEVARFNTQNGRRTRVCGGVRSFDSAWSEAVAQQTPRMLSASQRRLLLLVREVATVDPSGVVKIKAGRSRLGVNSYWSHELPRLAGQRVVVMFDPDRLSADAALYNLDGRYVCDVQHRPTAAFDSVDAGRENAKFKRRLVKATKAGADAQTRMDAQERAALYGSGAAPEAAGTPDFCGYRSRKSAGSPAAPQAPKKRTGKVVEGHFRPLPDPVRDRQRPALPKVADGDTVSDRFTSRMAAIAEAHFAKPRL